MSSKAEIESRYKRLHRFFAQFNIDYTVLARWLFDLFFRSGDKLYITMDRTNWYWGKSKINVLTLAVAYEGLAIPLFWTLLPKAGNATAKEHIALLKRFVETFGKSRIQGVLGDREFASGAFFKWCNKQRITYRVGYLEKML